MQAIISILDDSGMILEMNQGIKPYQEYPPTSFNGRYLNTTEFRFKIPRKLQPNSKVLVSVLDDGGSVLEADRQIRPYIPGALDEEDPAQTEFRFTYTRLGQK